MSRKRPSDTLIVGAPMKKTKPTPVTAVDKSLARRIKKLEDQEEVKYTNLFQGYTTIPLESTAPYWVINVLNNAVQGTGQDGNRVGTQLTCKKLSLRLSFLQNTANVTDNRVRIVLFWNKNANSILPTAPQLFDLSYASVPPTYAYFNEQFKDSFQVLYDRTIELKPLDWNGTTTTIGDQITINKSFNLHNKRVRYVNGAGAGTYLDILDNALYLAVMTSAASGAAGVNNPQFICSSRMWYVDD